MKKALKWILIVIVVCIVSVLIALLVNEKINQKVHLTEYTYSDEKIPLSFAFERGIYVIHLLQLTLLLRIVRV